MLPKKSFFETLRFRLMLLVLSVFLPVAMLTLYDANDNRRQKVLDIQASCLQLAQIVAMNEAQILHQTRLLLTAAANHLQGRINDPIACRNFLRGMLKQYSDYANFGVIAPDGNVLAAALPQPGLVNRADRQFFRLALETHDFAIGDYQVGRLTSHPSINCRYPVLAADGRVQVVLYAPLALDGLSPLKHEVKPFYTQREAEHRLVLEKWGWELTAQPPPRIR